MTGIEGIVAIDVEKVAVRAQTGCEAKIFRRTQRALTINRRAGLGDIIVAGG